VIRTSVEALLLAGWSNFRSTNVNSVNVPQFDVADDEKCDVHCNLACVQFERMFTESDD
jgi:hypothetical protein